MLSVILVLIAVNIVGYVVVFLVLRERVRRSSTSSAQAAEVRDEVNRLVVELNQTTERNIGLIEERIAGLSELLSRADKKIGLLRRESEKHDVGVRVYDRILEARGQPEGEPPVPAPAQRRTPAREADAAAELRAVPGLRVEPEGGAGVSAAGPGDVREQVLALHRAGFSAALIASKVGAPKGEVDLIISLSERKGFA